MGEGPLGTECEEVGESKVMTALQRIPHCQIRKLHAQTTIAEGQDTPCAFPALRAWPPPTPRAASVCDHRKSL